MPIKINGTNTTAQPSITGTDTDTGLVYGTDEVKIVTGGTDRVVTGTDIVFKNASGTERMRLASDGVISTTNHAECLIVKGDQSISGGDATTTVCGFDTFVYNRGGFTNSSDKLIVPKTGFYRCTFGYEAQITASAYGIRAMKIVPRINSTDYVNWQNYWNSVTNGGVTSNIHFNFESTYYLNLTANDQIDAFIQWYPGSDRTETFHSRIQMFYIG